MIIRRLGWAGIEIEYRGDTIVVDLLEERAPLGEALALDQPLPPPSRIGEVSMALVTHLHADHADPQALIRALAPGAPVFRPEPGEGPFADEPSTAGVETALRDLGLNSQAVRVWDSRTIGAFRVTACPAVDGLGDPQVSWVIEVDGVRMFHGGDTMFHGYWWAIAKFVGRVDIAFLPINGPVLEGVPGHSPSSPIPAVLLPEEAAVAADILGAHTVVPIHYGLDRSPAYVQTPDAISRFERAVTELGLRPLVLQAGERFEVQGPPVVMQV